MDVRIVIFPETRVAAIEHFGSPASEYDTARKLIAWKLENRFLDPLKYRSYGVHYTDPRTTPPADHHVDFCLSFEKDVGLNPYGIINKVFPVYDALTPVMLAPVQTIRPQFTYMKNGYLKAVNHSVIFQCSFTMLTLGRMCGKKR